MLSNEQIDQMEQMIYFAEPDEVMDVLSKLIPVLFAELRITRGTLDSKVSQFLGDVNEQHHAPEDEGDAPSDKEPVRKQRDVDTVVEQSVQSQHDGKGGDGSSASPDRRKKNTRKPARKKGTRKKTGSDKRELDTRTGKAEIRRKDEAVKKKPAGKSSKPDVAVAKESDIEFPDLS
jgi:hypothetical protein